jgi:hypothetical protein
MEYVLHRWLGHDPRFRPSLFAPEHVRHHGEGNDGAPSWKKAWLADPGTGRVRAACAEHYDIVD